jgi:sec-independent protein translocase protein TatC
MGHGEEATLVEHLDELRSRLVLCLLAAAVSFGVAYGFHDRLMTWLRDPLPPDRRHALLTLGVTEPFFTSLKVSFYAGLALALPFCLWQLWSFLAPALAEHHQRVVALFVGFATVLFAGGLVFAYKIVLPPALHFLTDYDSHLYNVQIRAASYYTFVTAVLVAVALVFELPIFVLALVRLGITSAGTLRRNRRIGYVLVVIVAVLLPTVDPVSLAFEAVPLLLLFELSIWLAVYFERRWWPTSEAPAPSG